MSGEGTDGENDRRAEDNDVLLTLPDDLRGAFKEPFGPVSTDPHELLEAVSGPIVAVGDVVTYHLLEAGRRPDVAVLDGYTERTPVDEAIREGTDEYGAYDRHRTVGNPAATLTASLLDALAGALDGIDRNDGAGGTGSESTETTVIDVDGEEDLCTLPAIVAAPHGTTVVYGQPGEGMVRVPVDGETRERARELIERMDGDHERVWTVLGVPTR